MIVTGKLTQEGSQNIHAKLAELAMRIADTVGRQLSRGELSQTQGHADVGKGKQVRLR